MRETIEYTIISMKKSRVKHALSGNHVMLFSKKCMGLSNEIH